MSRLPTARTPPRNWTTGTASPLRTRSSNRTARPPSVRTVRGDDLSLDGDAFAETDELREMDRELDAPDPSVDQGATTGDEQVDDGATDGTVDDSDEPTADGLSNAESDARVVEGQSNGESGEAPADDDAVPFTSLDVGENDPLSDPLLGGDGDDDDSDDGDAGSDGDGDSASDDVVEDGTDAPDDESGGTDGPADDADGDRDR